MKDVIIPDVHLKHARVEAIIAAEPDADRRIYLGDWFDDFHDSPEKNAESAQWVRQRIENTSPETDIFLAGNHDMQYLFTGIPDLICSGYGAQKRILIRHILQDRHIGRFRLFCVSGSFLVSHAGVAEQFLIPPEVPTDYKPNYKNLELLESCALTSLAMRRMHPLVAAGRARGGNSYVGGLTWLDWDEEFAPVPGYRQIVGHTRGRTVRERAGNYCIDCDLDFYAVVEDGEVSFRESYGL